MKMSKAEYEELIRKKPSLRPTAIQEVHHVLVEGIKERIKSQNTPANHSSYYELFVECAKQGKTLEEFMDSELDKFFPKEVEGSLESKGVPVPIVPQRSFVRPPTLVFTIPGQPVGKPRQTQSDRWKKRPCVMRYRAWADKARASVPLGVSLGVYRQIAFVAYLEFPKFYPPMKRMLLAGQPHLQKPDVDNILKGFDALFPEDKFIWKVSGEKRWDDGAGARIEVELR